MKEEQEVFEVDYLASAEFDLSEAIKDFVHEIKEIKKDVDNIKEHLNLNIDRT